MAGLHLLYWHWLVFGMVLILLELVVPSFTIFWFGLGALTVGLLLLLVGLSLTWQIFLWVLASSAFTLFWFKVLRPRMTDRTKAGLSREAVVGETAMVVRAPDAERRGELRFAVPVLGAETWSFLCSAPVAVGARVIVRDVAGNSLIVEPVEPQGPDPGTAEQD
ncbi:MAG: NfeD family protein [Desulfuromonadales bacterium]|nr:NfeD family protein [Desulfuromonadales bacterium]